LESVVPEELSFTGEVTPDQLVAAGRDLFTGGGGCTTCHGLETRAPNLRVDFNGEGTIGQRCDGRVSGQTCKEYLLESITNPSSYVVEGFSPMVFQARVLSSAQIWSLIAYLEDQGGVVTVTGADLASSQEADASAQADAGGAAPGGPVAPLEIMEANLCFGCHVLGDQGFAVGPPLTGIGVRLSADAIRESILDPGAEASEGYEHLLGAMPTTFAQVLSDAQVEVLVWYLASQR
jgi:mono/diheme cytochrome c family protein